MREIIFRAWLIKEKKLIQLDSPGDSPNITMDPLLGAVYVDDALYGDDDIVLEQFTGLTDTNGKDIYEGDIVIRRACGEMDAEFTVIFEDGRFGLDDKHAFGVGTIYPDGVEVIGNIHESPSLLSKAGGKS